jgi:hypothetical protein
MWSGLKPTNIMPIAFAEDPAKIITINARLFSVQEYYIDHMIAKFKMTPGINLTQQDKDILNDITEGASAYGQ